MNENEILVEVCFANPTKQKMIALNIKKGTTIREAIHLSQMLSYFPEIDLMTHKIGIFGQIRSLDEIVNANDRIEIYRPLLIDPKQARRLRA